MWYVRLKDSIKDRMDASSSVPENFEFIIDEIHWTKEKRLRVSENGYRARERKRRVLRRSSDHIKKYIKAKNREKDH